MLQSIKNKLFLSAEEGRLRNCLWLYPLSFFWSIGAKVKNALYDRRVLPVHRLPACVVSVGNLVAGGSGKTPLVHLLAGRQAGSVAILSRGYKAKKSNLALGDELTMLAQRLPSVKMVIGPDRFRSGQMAIQEGARLIILDDGLQYRRLFRDFELVIMDASNPFGFGAFLPRGILRDPPSRLKEADAIFLNGASTPELFQTLSSLTKAPLIGVKLHFRRVLDEKGQETSLKGRKVGAVCAIARPHRFLQTLAEAGAEVVDHWFLPDHDCFDLTRLKAFEKKCREKGADKLVCTEKDRVKFPSDFSILYLEMELQIISGEADWQNLLKKIALKLNN